MIPILTSNLLASAGFRHGFSTRLGGVSKAPFEHLDFTTQRASNVPDGLVENQRRLAEAVGFDREQLHQCTQVHGAAFVVAEGDPKSTLSRSADALVAEPGTEHAVGIRVADCVPVLLADPRSGRVAAVHAGWRGVAGRILANVVARLESSSNAGEAREYVAAIGPCIGACCFETGIDVAENIASASSVDVVVSRDDSTGKAHVDLRKAVRRQLRSLGLDDARIEDVPSANRAGCTRCDAERFYSYRRDGEASGRLIGVIVASTPHGSTP